jgi:hypothetical protein
MNKRKQGNTVIGYDINDTNAHISYMTVGETEPQTASAVLGVEQYDIPVALRPKPGTRLWLYGKEALKADDTPSETKRGQRDQDNNPAITRLLDLAIAGTPVTVDEEQIDPVLLLALFIKRSLSILTISIKASDIAAFMFTTPTITPRIVEIFHEVARNLDMAPERVYFQSYRESFFQYVVHQPHEFWKHQVLLFDYSSHMKVMQMKNNKRTTPTVVYIESESHPSFYYTATPSAATHEDWDKRLLAIAEQVTKGVMISSVYLVGEGFKDEWAHESLKYLCRESRVFRGNNLYSKGACHAAMEKHAPTKISQAMVFLGEDRLKANIGMRLLQGGEESYYAILDAGTNWYECENNFEIIMDNGSDIALVITALTGGIVSERLISLDGLPERERRTTRLRIDITMESVSTIRLEVTDLGFGEIYPESGKAWVREVEI